MQKDFPKATFALGKYENIDCGALANHISQLNNILEYLEEEELASVHIIDDAKSPIQVEKERRKLKIQKKNLRKISSKLNNFVKEIIYFLRSGIKYFQITAEMREHIKYFYGEILKIYSWYAELFKKELRK